MLTRTMPGCGNKRLQKPLSPHLRRSQKGSWMDGQSRSSSGLSWPGIQTRDTMTVTVERRRLYASHTPVESHRCY